MVANEAGPFKRCQASGRGRHDLERNVRRSDMKSEHSCQAWTALKVEGQSVLRLLRWPMLGSRLTLSSPAFVFLLISHVRLANVESLQRIGGPLPSVFAEGAESAL
jgi:hypothetical protein